MSAPEPLDSVAEAQEAKHLSTPQKTLRVDARSPQPRIAQVRGMISCRIA